MPDNRFWFKAGWRQGQIEHAKVVSQIVNDADKITAALEAERRREGETIDTLCYYIS